MIMFKKGEIDCTMKMQRSLEYIEALEEEQKKIQVFKRELPLCSELISQVIESWRKELSGSATSEHLHGQSECSERTMSESGGGGAVFEEFIPMKSTSSSDENGEPASSDPKNDGAEMESENKIDKKKSDWLRSVQLWNQSPDPQLKEGDVTKKSTAVEIKTNGGAFHPFQKDKTLAVPKLDSPPQPPTTSSSTPESGECKKESEHHKQPQTQTQSLRKQRRCWSPELHRRFLNALQQLGGSQVATPKQIRDLMKVDGLTNDEVKSHLQKYRLHTRIKTAAATPVREKVEEAQFMMVKWIPATDVTTSNKVYAPVAVQPPPLSPKRTAERSSGRGRCNSPANILFHTNTASSPLS